MFFEAEHFPKFAPLLPGNASKGLLRGKSWFPQPIPSGSRPNDSTVEIAYYLLALLLAPIRAQASGAYLEVRQEP